MLEPTRALRAITPLVFVLLIWAHPARAQAPDEGRETVRSGPGTHDPDAHLVPWHVHGKGTTLTGVPITLYWLPASQADLERSSLIDSRTLLQAAGRCVAFEIVRPDDAATIAAFDATGKLPAAVVIDAQGKVVRRVENVRGTLRTPAVEQMVSQELNAHDQAMYLRITEARKLAAAGERDAAIELYRKLWDERCLFPLVGSEVRQALKELGVTVAEPPPAAMPTDPNLTVVPPRPKKRSEGTREP